MIKLPQSEARELEVLRQLLVGPELIKLDQLSKRLENSDEFSSDVGEVLPQAFIKSADQSEKLSQAMMSTVEEIVRLSVKRDINKFADALFPVIGPAIRKSISESIREMMQSMNQMLENSFSSQGIKWRLESIRTGVPFSQIVMLKSLQYRVEQVFLIHQTTGLLLHHVTRDGSEYDNADMVSSMLAAIGDFVNDSFDSRDGESLGSIAVGDFSVWIERSPGVILALAIRGNAPQKIRITMQETLEQIESLYTDAILSFKGDVSVFESTGGLLSACLEEQQSIQRKQSSEEKKSPIKLWLGALILLLGLAYWFGSSIYQSSLENDYLSMLEVEPGYVITQTRNIDGLLQINGLRDPLSRPPEAILLFSKLNVEDVKHRLRPYQSLEQSIVLTRLQIVLLPPANVTLSINNGELTISGFGSEAWFELVNHRSILTTGISRINNQLNHKVDFSSLKLPETVDIGFDIDEGRLSASGYATREWRELANLEVQKIPGILSYDDSGLIEIVDAAVFQPPDTVDLQLDAESLSVSGEVAYQWLVLMKEKLAEYPQITDLDTSNLRITEELLLETQIQQLQDQKIFFEAATSYNFDANDSLEQVAALIRKIINNADILKKSPKIIVKGYSDSVGSFEDNAFLSLKRADYVSQYLFNTGISPLYVLNEGLEEPVIGESTEEERRFNRRVEFIVEIKEQVAN